MFESLGASITNLLTGLADWVTGASSLLTSSFEGIGSTIKTSIEEAAGSVGTSIKSAFSDVIEVFKTQIVDKLLDLPGRFVDIFNQILSRMEDALSFDLPGGGGLVSGTGTPLDKLHGEKDFTLEGGELVVPRNDVSELRSFLASQKGGSDSSETNALLAQIVQAIGGQDGGTSISISEDGLSDLLLDFDRRGERLTA